MSPYSPANALNNPYPFSVSAAASLLKSHGWKVVPGGVSTCAKPGTGAGECGGGIPAGTKLTFNLLYINDPAIWGEMLTDWASDAKKVGIAITLQTGTFNHVVDVADDPGSPKTINQWAMSDYGGFTDDPYPTTFGIFNTAGLGQRRLLQRHGGQQADQRVGDRREPGCRQGRGLLPDRSSSRACSSPTPTRSSSGRTTSPASRPRSRP